MTDRAAIAAMLRDGATYRHISAQLGASHHAIAAVRKTLAIAVPDGRAGSHQRRGIRDQVADMLRAGATYRDIIAKLRVSVPRIADVRRTQGIPVPDDHAGPYTVRTPEETLTHYSHPAADGHTHWTGPLSGRTKPQIWYQCRSLSGLRVAFRAHHGREPDGRVLRGCDDPQCITGAHLTDHTIRQSHTRADAAYDAIFGT
ncbi:hypothetical protein [Streptomyces ipomoeae]|uniref:hypothetical protein n=1 Tax=Streptomyces ipomoeae TaxID=103232 RepID=UPI0015F02F3A|nr:hypothetical protein [Streptomyces ipomoeae]